MSRETIEDHYPQSCPFCSIASAYPANECVASSSSSLLSSHPADGDASSHLLKCIPSTLESDPKRVEPNAFVVLSAPDVIAFLDILPMTRGHLLLATRQHSQTLVDVGVQDGRAIGFWLPLLCRTVSKVTGITDYNVVQNNGQRAAQVVPHVHFHIIPRPGTKPQLQNKSWTMFGRGQRDDLDEDEAAEIAARMREVLTEEVKSLHCVIGNEKL